MHNTEPIIKFEGVDITNGENTVIYSLDLTVEEGSFTYLTGRVGSGKTSIIRAIIGENPVTTGKARVAGFDMLTLKNRQIPYLRRQMGIIFQDFQLLADRTVHDNLKFILKATDWQDDKAVESRIVEVLDAVDMRRKAHRMPHQLSGGEQQRVAIARALLNFPKIIIADEPTGNIDFDTACGIMDLLLTINREHGTAILMVTHDRALIRKYPAPVLRCASGKCSLQRDFPSGENEAGAQMAQSNDAGAQIPAE